MCYLNLSILVIFPWLNMVDLAMNNHSSRCRILYNKSISVISRIYDFNRVLFISVR